jgi:hypothetical protein
MVENAFKTLAADFDPTLKPNDRKTTSGSVATYLTDIFGITEADIVTASRANERVLKGEQGITPGDAFAASRLAENILPGFLDVVTALDFDSNKATAQEIIEKIDQFGSGEFMRNIREKVYARRIEMQETYKNALAQEKKDFYESLSEETKQGLSDGASVYATEVVRFQSFDRETERINRDIKKIRERLAEENTSRAVQGGDLNIKPISTYSPDAPTLSVERGIRRQASRAIDDRAGTVKQPKATIDRISSFADILDKAVKSYLKTEDVRGFKISSSFNISDAQYQGSPSYTVTIVSPEGSEIIKKNRLSGSENPGSLKSKVKETLADTIGIDVFVRNGVDPIIRDFANAYPGYEARIEYRLKSNPYWNNDREVSLFVSKDGKQIYRTDLGADTRSDVKTLRDSLGKNVEARLLQVVEFDKTLASNMEKFKQKVVLKNRDYDIRLVPQVENGELSQLSYEIVHIPSDALIHRSTNMPESLLRSERMNQQDAVQQWLSAQEKPASEAISDHVLMQIQTHSEAVRETIVVLKNGPADSWVKNTDAMAQEIYNANEPHLAKRKQERIESIKRDSQGKSQSEIESELQKIERASVRDFGFYSQEDIQTALENIKQSDSFSEILNAEYVSSDRTLRFKTETGTREIKLAELIKKGPQALVG